MGKLLLIFIIVFVMIIGTVFVRLYDRADNFSTSVAENDTQFNATKFANTALQRGVVQLINEDELPNIEDIESAGVYKFIPTSSIESDGVIDSLIYTIVAQDTIMLVAYVTYVSNANTISSQSRMVFAQNNGGIILGNIPNALSTYGQIKIQNRPKFHHGEPRAGIHGNVLSQSGITYQNQNSYITGSDSVGTFPSFDEIFGISMGEVQNVANYVGTNPPNYSGITVVTGSAHINGNGTGRGILVVIGDLHINGNFTFNGVIWTTGQLLMNGNCNITGAVFAQSSMPHQVKGSYLLIWDPNLSGGVIPPAGRRTVKVLSIWEDIKE